MSYYDKIGANKYEDIVMLFRQYNETKEITLDEFISKMNESTKMFGRY